ncbi:hypothetical protein HAX54_003485 [Datura stramonium]|uniref:RING-type domain-containing protein n=1 Tax=Datura stramonium TaxID=4076 RepID=A0ABS8RTZ9_DATST|nr:hypothetical protein [Datura stramonium]
MAELLRERMDGNDRVVRRRKSLTERLGFAGSIACCGTTLCLRPASSTVVDEDDDSDESVQAPPQAAEVDRESPPETESDNLLCLDHIPAGSGMNLAAALLAERNFRAGQDTDDAANSSPSRGPNTSPLRSNDDGLGTGRETPYRMSLMRLLEETNGWDEKEEGARNDTVCCVCMGRKKGAAFIPCGHTYCRVCSRELWLNRGYCPLCNRSILEILDIY